MRKSLIPSRFFERLRSGVSGMIPIGEKGACREEVAVY